VEICSKPRREDALEDENCGTAYISSFAKTCTEQGVEEPPEADKFFRLMLFAGFHPKQRSIMKKTLIRLILVGAALLALSATTAMADGGGPVPLCFPGDSRCPLSTM
jgi:hypothetical protein